MNNFRFIDLFAGIGGFRIPLEKMGGNCVFSCDWNKFSQQTYEENFNEKPLGDINNIDIKNIPDHDLLLAGFPCQPFSIAGVSKKKSLGRKHGFLDKVQGTLFFNIAEILDEKRPDAFILENVKNLISHNKGHTFKTILKTLKDLEYHIFHEIVDAQHFVPQHRERIFIFGFRKDIYPDVDFVLPEPPRRTVNIRDVLQNKVDPKYTLSDHLWKYLQNYAKKHREKGNGFGYGLVDPLKDQITRTLSARYYKDGAEILIKQKNKNPRRLTPRECARIMGFDDSFRIVVSDTQAYMQFGNAVSPPVVEYISKPVLEVLNGSYIKGPEKSEYVKDKGEKYNSGTVGEKTLVSQGISV